MFANLTINTKTKKGGLDIKTYQTLESIYRYGIQIKKDMKDYGHLKN